VVGRGRGGMASGSATTSECPPCDELDLETEWRSLDALTVVDTVRNDRTQGFDRVICTLWCKSCHTKGKQPSVTCNKSTVPNLEMACRVLRTNIERDHAGCVAAAEAARSAANGPATRPPPDVLAVMMAQASARRADNKAAAAEALAEAARKEAAALRAAAEAEWAKLPQPAKRQRADAASLEFWKPWLESTPPSVTTWNVKQWRDYEDEEQKRRAVKIAGEAAGSAAGTEPLPPRGGKEGYLHHWRRGLLGAVRSWARGSEEHVVSMIVDERHCGRGQ